MVPMDLIGICVINIIPFITNIFHIIPYCPCCSNGFNRIFHYNKWKKDLYSNGYYSMDYDEWIFIGLFQWIFYYKPFSYWGYHGQTMETLSRPPLRNLVRWWCWLRSRGPSERPGWGGRPPATVQLENANFG